MALVVAACSDGGRSPRSEGSTSIADASTSSTSRTTDAATALRRYVEAINQGDVVTAMELRCADARVPEERIEAFASDAAALIDSIGPLEVSSVEPARELAPVEGLLQYSLEGHEGSLTIAEDGEDGFCFWRPAASYELQRQLDAPVDLGDATVPTEQLLPSSVGEGYELAPTPLGGDSSSTAPEQVSRSWQAAPFGGVTVTVGTYPDTAAALADAALLLDVAVADGVAAVDLVATPEVRAVRMVGYGWLWVQPPSVGPFIDRAVMPFGRVLVTVQVSGLDAAAVDAQLETVTAEIAARARPSA